MKLKEGVVLAGLRMKMRPALVIADKLWLDFGQELVITCGLNGSHSAGSLHYYGFAVDCRTHYFSPEQLLDLFQELQDRLPEEFDAVLEETHIHLEYDPKTVTWA